MDEIAKATDLIHNADALIIGAGAGMGVDSGLPDFRGKEGFWRAYPALQSRGMSFTQVASPQTFERDPALAWGFYGHRLALYRRTVPHEGFAILRRWAESKKGRAFVFTSNVDGQFQKAAFHPQRIWEMHGSIHRLQCTACHVGVWDDASFEPEVDAAECRLINEPPRCAACGSIARPNILMFGDWGWDSSVSDQQERAFESWIAAYGERAVVIEVGAGTDIPSVRWRGEAWGVPLIRINPREAEVHRRGDVGLAGGALDMLRAIDERLV